MTSNINNKYLGIVLYDHCTLLDFAGATQVFAKWASGWTPVWLAQKKGPIMTSEGLEVVANYSLDDFSSTSRTTVGDDAPNSLDVIFVPGGAGDGVATAMQNKALLNWLNDQARNSQTWIGSVCVGAFIVAAAGLMRGESVSTHWLLIDQLQRLHEKYDLTALSAKERYNINDKTRRFSGGGVSTSIDLALGLLNIIDGLDKANTAALAIQYAPQLPHGVLPGSPDKTDPKYANKLENSPSINQHFISPIRSVVDQLV